MLSARGLPHLYVTSVFSVLSVITVSLRFYARHCLLKSFGLDDFLMIIACFIYLVFCGLCITGVNYGIGKHMSELNDFDIERAMLIWWITYLLYGVIITIVKTSVGLFLLRITMHKHQRWALWHAIHVSIITGIIFFFIVAFQCSPVSFFWKRFLVDDRPDGKCIRPYAYIALGYYFSVICIVTDLIFAGQPLFLIYSLLLSGKDKAVLTLIMTMATIACFAPIVRASHLQSLRSDDFLYATTDVAIWSAVEPGLAITASSLATLRPLWRHIHPPKPASGASQPPKPLFFKFQVRSLLNSGDRTQSVEQAADKATPRRERDINTLEDGLSPENAEVPVRLDAEGFLGKIFPWVASGRHTAARLDSEAGADGETERESTNAGEARALEVAGSREEETVDIGIKAEAAVHTERHE